MRNFVPRERAGDAPPEPDRQLNVLIAEDDPLVAEYLVMAVEDLGCRAEAVTNGQMALDRLLAKPFDVLVTDWMMPEMDGVELVRRVRAGSASRPGYVYAILLTAKSQKDDLVEGMEAGADDFLTKPFDRDELRVRLRAGERIMLLEQQLREAKAALAEAAKPGGRSGAT